MTKQYKRKPACYAPWITSYEYPTGDVVPCCEWNNNMSAIKTKEHMSLKDRFNHPVMQKIKDKLLTSSILPPECLTCVKMEQNNQLSLRNQFDERVADTERKTDWVFDPKEFNLFHMDYRESNLCNFSCMMCGSNLSSTHAKINGEYGKTGILSNHHKLEAYLDELDNVQIINFLGGEPLLTESMWVTLREIKSRGLEGQIDISIVTNGSLLHRSNESLIDLLEGFKFVDFAVSLDCIGDQHNYWRQKNTWAQIEKNCEILYEWKQSREDVNCAVRTAIGWPNAYAARDVFDKFKGLDVEMRWNLITFPAGLSVSNFPKEELKKLAEYWKDYPDVAEMFNTTVSRPNIYSIVSEVIKLDRIQEYRDITFEEAFPETSFLYRGVSNNKNNPYLG